MKKILAIGIVLFVAVIAYSLFMKEPYIHIERRDEAAHASSDIQKEIAKEYNKNRISLVVNKENIIDNIYQGYISDKLEVMLPVETFVDKMNCSVNVYANGTITLEKGDNKVKVYMSSVLANINGVSIIMAEQPQEIEGQLYIPVNDICNELNYTCDFNYKSGVIELSRIEAEDKLPAKYDMREYDRVTEVRDQGSYGTCWAFASLAALETTLMPEERLQFSVDHMTLNNSFSNDQMNGGQYRMSIAYLAAWQGPVLEKDDPYGDGETNTKLKAVKHLEEALILDEKDYEAVKSAIYKYGGVESVIYCDMTSAKSSSYYYNKDRASYYYNGSRGTNHDIVIVGWDDNYPKEFFNVEPEGDGAFICKNSWGTEFGDNGYFYVSYYDVNICETSVVYTKLGDKNNYDKIYQSDLLGFNGVLGFSQEDAYFANVYKAGKNEDLKAVSFYATGNRTSYAIYVVKDFKSKEDLNNRILVASGEMEYSGYYTINLNEPIELPDNEKFAVIVHINTPGSELPIAIEYNAGAMTQSFDITDGEGYISLHGNTWYSAEKDRECNVCLKAFTSKRK